MKYTFVQQEAFSVVGKQETVVYGEGNDTFEPAMWKQIEAIEAEVKPYSNTELSGVLHLSFTNDDGDIDYMIAAATTQACPDHLKQWDIPAHTWAVFHVEGKRSENMLDTWERVYTEWFPISGYELAKAPEIIRGVEEGFEIWIPVQKGKIQN
ncbi:GyrI-like domain-containing protein [Alkalicoccus luteus]|uniref:GyrI-like domain-containing protein n=1 Tax=Alkalicoccus luteus TaxID=1237094 RepID=UPI0040343546